MQLLVWTGVSVLCGPCRVGWRGELRTVQADRYKLPTHMLSSACIPARSAAGERQRWSHDTSPGFDSGCILSSRVRAWCDRRRTTKRTTAAPPTQSVQHSWN